MAITAARVKELRDKTGAGMMDAKKALTECDGDMDGAVDWLRSKGLAKAAKKQGRTAADGLVAVSVEGGTGVAVEVNAETDFVAKNDEFQEMVRGIAGVAMGASDVAELVESDLGGKKIKEVVTDKIATIGENITVRRMSRVEADGVVAYVHNQAAEGMGKIGVLVGFTGGDANTARQIAMHIAAVNPASLGESDLDPQLIEREKQVLTEQARESGKPEQVIEKMIQGRMKKFFSEVTLVNQAFVVNPDVTVGQAAADAGIEVTSFVRLEVGEGIEVAGEDFAAEVAKVSQA